MLTKGSFPEVRKADDRMSYNDYRWKALGGHTVKKRAHDMHGTSLMMGAQG